MPGHRLARGPAARRRPGPAAPRAGRAHRAAAHGHRPALRLPGGAIPAGADWPTAFTAMMDALLADADRFAVHLPVPAARLRELTGAATPALAEVTVPVLVHFDLWDGNVLLHEGRVSALIDGERMFWGDPLAELTSLNLLGMPDDDPALLAGYGTTTFDDAAHTRMALYRCYLNLIMLIEATPRGYGQDRHAWLDEHVAPALLADVELLEKLR
ncbi:phosphotransferase family protein [Streptomyces litchfieldiae]|uniref:Phosphotransferase n=1 Tax=Streptomyces litchfieldiae TaxID=3075543 RepID=A0ABU2MPH7_9ACTN|nr:phosphotransferase [Streptomyces sp. DSM 44938]MDT0343302.1 phosphotransferase [Streptomyces sp. DSM 44938]